jgi:phosphoribosyl-AMP cyclohydrolase
MEGEMDAEALEEGSEFRLDFDKVCKVAESGTPVLPVVVQDSNTGTVLLIGYANQQALDHTLQHGLAALWSTSRNELWIKGATSGDTLRIEEVRVNCEQNSLLYLVKVEGEGACHTKRCDGTSRLSCYYRRISGDGQLEPIRPQAGTVPG